MVRRRLGALGPDGRLASAALAILGLVLVVASAGAHAHAGAAVAVEAREDEACIADPVCLELVGLPADREPGHASALELQVHPNASRSYEAALAPGPEADPDREATPRSAAVAVVGPVEPGERARLNLTLPDTAEAYVWLPDGDHEAQGGWEIVPLASQSRQSGEPSSQDVAAPGAAVLASILGLLAAGRVRR